MQLVADNTTQYMPRLHRERISKQIFTDITVNAVCNHCDGKAQASKRAMFEASALPTELWPR